MQTLKKGSRGSDVKKLQELLLMPVADGIFGPSTEAYLVEFQATHGLTPDGICGPKTWSALLSEPATKETLHGIIYSPINVHITKSAGRKIKYLAIHYTAGISSTQGKALANRNVFLKSEASADFVVDDKDIVQVNPDLRNYYCWAIGGKTYKGYGGASYKGVATNSNTISIEVCSTHFSGTDIEHPNHKGWYFSPSAVDNAVRIARYLMKTFNIPIERVIRHYDVNGKPCPGIIGWNDAPLFDYMTGKQLDTNNTSEAWHAFKKRLS